MEPGWAFAQKNMCKNRDNNRSFFMVLNVVAPRLKRRVNLIVKIGNKKGRKPVAINFQLVTKKNFSNALFLLCFWFFYVIFESTLKSLFCHPEYSGWDLVLW